MKMCSVHPKEQLYICPGPLPDIYACRLCHPEVFDVYSYSRVDEAIHRICTDCGKEHDGPCLPLILDAHVSKQVKK